MLRVTPADGGAEVTLGEPVFDWERIPLAMPMDTRDMPVAWDELEHGAAVNVGNPPILFFVPADDAGALAELGRSEERSGGKEWASTCRSVWLPYTSKTKTKW